ncbi:MAG TPA: hypothetical protein VLQ48_06115 [Chloroflexia bacterium]|nr:hypothetical protein [Chloroflexia bacterium]
MTLTSPEFSGMGGGDQPSNRREQEIFNLWKELSLNQTDPNSNHMNIFLQRLRHLL